MKIKETVNLTGSFLGIVLSIFFISFLVFATGEWTSPTATAPGNNVSAPLNSGSETQFKTGALGVGGILETVGIKIDSGTTEKPTCNETTRGMMWIEKGETGEADKIEFCFKHNKDQYSWNTQTTAWQCGDSFTDTRDGNTYPTVEIGTQCWTAKNMAYLPSVVPSATGSTSAPYYYVQGYQGTSVSEAKATSNYQTYGVLYNHLAAQAACPTGWRLPTDTEQYVLENYLSEGTCNGDRASGTWDCDPAGAKLAGGYDLWTNGTLKNHTSFNSSGFSALPGGHRDTDGSFYYLGTNTYFWSSSSDGSSAWSRYLYYTETRVNRYLYSSANGFSVRCVRD